MKNKQIQKKRQAPVIEALEPRILFSADVFAVAIDGIAVNDPLAAQLENTVAVFEEQQNRTTKDIEPDSLIQKETLNGPLEQVDESVRTELVIVDTATSDYQLLVDNILSQSDGTVNIEVVLLNAEQDGITQLSEILFGYSDLDAVHLISHGSAGEISLGTSTLNAESLSENSGNISNWSDAFLADGDLLIYGCNLAENEDGRSLVDSLASITGADVAASDDLTGHTDLGGDWELEYQQGIIETDVAFSTEVQETWNNILGLDDLTGAWTGSGPYTATTTATNPVSVDMSFTTPAGTTVQNVSTNSLTTSAFFSNSYAEGADSIYVEIFWDNSGPSGDAPIDPAAVGTITVTFTFDTAVVNPIIHIDKLGGSGGTTSNSSEWTVTTAGASLTQLAGVGHLDVTASSFSRTPFVSTDPAGSEASADTALGSAAGSIQVNGTYTTLTFDVTGIGVEGAGGDGVELAWELDANVAPVTDNVSASGNEDALSIAVTLSGSDLDGTVDNFQLNNLPANGILYTDAGLSSIAATGTDYAATAESLTLYFVPDSNYNGSTGFDYVAKDNAGVLDTTPATATLTVDPVNDDPFNAGFLQAATLVTEDVASVIQLSWVDVSDVDAGTGALTLTLTTSTGGNLTALAGTGLTIAGNGTGALTLTGNLTDLNNYLDIVSNITYLHGTPHTNGGLADSIQVDITDNGNTGGGGGGTINFGSFDIDITAVNDAPVITSDGGGPAAIVNVTENQTAVTAVIASDVDVGDSLAFSISGTDAAFFSIDVNTGVLSFNSAPDFETPADADGDNVYEVTVEVNDGNSGTDTQAISVAVINTNEAPINLDLGMSATTDTQINTTTTSGQEFAQVTNLADGGYVVIWESWYQDGDFRGIYGQRYDVNGNSVGSEFQVNTSTTSNQYQSSVTGTADGGFVVAWTSGHNGPTGIFTQAYDSSGNTVGGEIEVPTTTVDTQISPQIAAFDSGGYVITWTSVNQDGSGEGVYVQRFDASHNPVGSETLVNTYTSNDQGTSQIATFTDDSYVIAWESWNQDGQFNGVYGQRFNSDGSSNGSEFQINTTTISSQWLVKVTSLSGGGFVATWHDGNDITAQLFDVNGSKLGGEIAVNTFTTNNQTYPSIASLPDGGFLISWDSDSQDGDLYGVFAQRFDGLGNQIGAEFQLSDATTGNQQFSELTTLDDGRVVAVWHSPDVDSSGVYSKIFSFSYVYENAANGTVVDTVIVADPDAGDTHSFAITADTSGGAFQINATTGEVTVADGSLLDFEAGIHAITVEVTDSGGLTYIESLSIAIADVNEAPTLVTLSNTNVSENTDTSSGYSVGSLTTTDEDSGDTASYVITGGVDAGLFSIGGPGNDELILADGVLDFESKPSYNVTVQVTDSGGLTYDQIFTISVIDLNEAPVDLHVTETDSGGLSLNDDGGNDTVLFADDGDAILGGLSQITAEIHFSMDTFQNSSGFLSYATSASDNTLKLNIRDDGNLSFTVNGFNVESLAMDYRTLADAAPHTLSVTWENSGTWQVFVDGSLIDSGGGLAVGQTLTSGGTLVIGNDQDTIGGGFDPASEFVGTLYDIRIFNDVRTNTEIADNYASTLPSNESGMVANWTFNDLSTSGLITDQVSGNNLTVNNAVGAGFVTSTAVLTLQVDENTTNGTIVGTLTGIDPDDDTLAYQLTDDAGGRFTIDINSGVITVADGSLLDFETLSTHNITVHVTDGGGLFYDEIVTISVADVNDAPITNNVSVTGNEDAAAIAITLSGSDIDGTVDFYQLNNLPANGILYTDAGLSIPAATGTDYAATAESLTLYFVPSANYNGATSFDYAAKDDAGLVDATAATATITVDPVNDAPVLDLDANDSSGSTGSSYATTYTEGAAAVNITDSDALLTDTDSANLSSMTITLTNALDSFDENFSYDVSGTSIAGVQNWDVGAGTVVLTLTGIDSVANYQQVLQTISYQTTSQSPDTTDRIITIVANDGTDDSNVGITTVAVNAVNDDPFNAGFLQSASVVTEDIATSINLSSIDVSDLDAASAALTLTLTTSTGGNLTALAGTGITIGSNGTGVLTLTGNLTDLNNYLDTAGNVSYLHGTANTNGLAADTIQVDITDNGNTGTGGGGVINIGTFNIDINAINDAPVASANSVSATEDNPVSFNVSDFTYSDVESDALVSATLTNINLAGGTLEHSGGTAVTNGMTLSAAEIATLIYTPAANANGSPLATFDFSVNDADLGVVAAQMSIDITPLNDAPITNNVSAAGAEDAASIAITLTGSDLDGTVDNFVLNNLPANGQLYTDAGLTTLAATATDYATTAESLILYFVPNTNYNGVTNFDYVAKDDAGLLDATAATATLTVNAVNDTPVASINTVSASEDNPVSFNVSDFTYSDVESDALISATLTSLNLAGGILEHSGGTAVNNGDTLTAVQLATLIYTPAANANGSPLATFDFSVNDADLGVVAAQMSIDITPVNDAPTTNNVSASGNEDAAAIAITLTGSDLDGTVDNFVLNNLPANGQLYTDAGLTSVAATATDYATTAESLTLYFVPDANYNGSNSFDYVAKDDAGLVDANAATASITVNAVNDAPVASINTVSAAEDNSYTFNVGDFTYADVESDALVSATLTNLSLAGGSLEHSGGTAVIDGMTLTAAELGTLIYTPAANATGLPLASFDFTVNDADLGVVATQMSIDITSVNDAPVTNNVSASGDEDAASIAISLAGSDLDGTVDNFVLNNLPANGQLYTDAGLTSVAATGTDYAATAESLTLYFVPDANTNGVTTFDYVAKDDAGLIDATAATATLIVNAVNDTPVASINNVSATEDNPVSFNVGDFTYADVESDALVSATLTNLNLAGGTLEHSGGTSVTNGMTLTAVELGTLVYTPAANANGSPLATFDFSVSDADLGVVAAQMSIDITPVNDAPTTNNVSASGNEDAAAIAITLTGSDLDGTVDFYQLNTLPANGILYTDAGLTSVAATGTDYAATAESLTLYFVPSANTNGLTTFDYVAKDDAGLVDATAATASITVNAVNDAPVASINTVNAAEDSAVSFNIGDFTYSDVESDALVSATITNLNLAGGTLEHSGGTTVNNGDTLTAAELASLIYTPATDANGSPLASFDFSVNDADLGVVAAQMNINITPVNDAPSTNNVSTSGNEDASSIAITLSGSDLDGTVDNFVLNNLPANGILYNDASLTTVAAIGTDYAATAESLTLYFVPNTNYNGVTNFDFVAKDDAGLLDATPATASLTINPVNDAPTTDNPSALGLEDVALIAVTLSGNDLDGTVDNFVLNNLPANGQLYTDTGLTSVVVTGADYAATAELLTLYFVPDSNYNGSTSFDYVAKDDAGLVDATPATATITISALNDDPFNSGSLISFATGSEDTPMNLLLNTINISDVDAGSGDLTLTLSTSGGGNLTALPGTGIVIGGNGTDAVTVTGNLVDLNNYLDTGGNVTYLHGVPNTNGNNVDTVQVAITDNGNTGTGGGATIDFGTIDINILPVNDKPVADNIAAAGNEDAASIAIALTGSDVDGTVNQFWINTLPADGTLYLDAGLTTVVSLPTLYPATAESLTLYFVPDANWNGATAFQYSAQDNNGFLSDQATASLTVNPVNDAPTTDNVSATGDEDAVSIAITLSGSDVEGTVDNFQLNNLPANGSLYTDAGLSNLAATGTDYAATAESLTLYFVPNSNYNGTSTFDFVAKDDTGLADATPATATLTVNPVNDVPVASANNVNASEDNPYSFNVGDFTYNDIESDPLVSATLTNLNLAGGMLEHSGGTPVINGMSLTAAQIATLIYTPAANANGSPLATFDFSVNDADLGVVAAQMSIDITPLNDAPTTNNVSAAGLEDAASIAISLTGSDLDGTVDNFQLNNLPANGSLYTDAGLSNLAATGTDYAATAESLTLYFVPDANYNGVTTFDYVTKDDAGLVDASPATATVTINPVNDTPVASINSVSATEDTPYSFNLGDFTYTDIESDALVSATLTNLNLTGGTLEHSGGTPVTNGMTLTAAELATLIYSPATNANGAALATFDFSVNDADLGVVSAQMSIDVSAVNDAPVITGNDIGTVTEDIAVIAGNVSDSGSLAIADPEAGESSFVANTITGAYGNLTIDTAGNWMYTADNNQVAIQQLDAGENLVELLTVVTADGTIHDITITINGAEDAPVITTLASGTVAEDGALTANGTLGITDVDSSDNPISFPDQTSALGSNGYGSFALSNGNWTYTLDNTHAEVQALDVGESLGDTHTYIASDGSTQLVSIIIDGAEDAPVISGVSSGTVAEDGVPGAAGVLNISDADNSDNPISFPDEAATLGDNGYGSFALSNGNWTYSLNNSLTVVQALDLGETLTDTHSFIASDGTTQVVTIRIDGALDFLVIDDENPEPLTQDSDGTGNEKDTPERAPQPQTQLDIAYRPGEVNHSIAPAAIAPLPMDAADIVNAVTDVQHDIEFQVFKEGEHVPVTPKFLDLKNLEIASFEPGAIEPLELRSQLDNDVFLDGLKRMNHDLDVAAEDGESRYQFGTEVAIGAALSLSAGFVSWLLRVGSLLASFMSVMPLWMQLDPLPVLGASDKERREDDDMTHENVSNEDNVEEIFKQEASSPDIVPDRSQITPN